MHSTPPLDARRPAPNAASSMPAEPEPAAAALDIAHCCPHCGRPLAVVNVLVPVDEPEPDPRPAERAR